MLCLCCYMSLPIVPHSGSLSFTSHLCDKYLVGHIEFGSKMIYINTIQTSSLDWRNT